jgi:heterokaryon incompatibility protein (HET)
MICDECRRHISLSEPKIAEKILRLKEQRLGVFQPSIEDQRVLENDFKRYLTAFEMEHRVHPFSLLLTYPRMAKYIDDKFLSEAITLLVWKHESPQIGKDVNRRATNGCELCQGLCEVVYPESATEFVFWSEVKLNDWNHCPYEIIIYFRKTEGGPIKHLYLGVIINGNTYSYPERAVDVKRGRLSTLLFKVYSLLWFKDEKNHLHSRKCQCRGACHTGSNCTVNFISERLRECTTHKSCALESISNYIPSRLLDLHSISPSIRLVFKHQLQEEKRNIVKYIALSYVWGGYNGIMLTESSMEKFKEGVEIEQLPQTFIDAIDLARKLGIQYL